MNLIHIYSNLKNKFPVIIEDLNTKDYSLFFRENMFPFKYQGKEFSIINPDKIV